MAATVGRTAGPQAMEGWRAGLNVQAAMMVGAMARRRRTSADWWRILPCRSTEPASTNTRKVGFVVRAVGSLQHCVAHIAECVVNGALVPHDEASVMRRAAVVVVALVMDRRVDDLVLVQRRTASATFAVKAPTNVGILPAVPSRRADHLEARAAEGTQAWIRMRPVHWPSALRLKGFEAAPQVCVEELYADPTIDCRRLGERGVESLLKDGPSWPFQPRIEHISMEVGTRVAVHGVVESWTWALPSEHASTSDAVSPQAQVGAAWLADTAHNEALLLVRAVCVSEFSNDFEFTGGQTGFENLDQLSTGALG